MHRINTVSIKFKNLKKTEGVCDCSYFNEGAQVQLTFWEIEKSEDRGFESGANGFEIWSSKIKGFKIDTYHVLAWHLALLG